jgi:hypothetical protein
MVNRGVILVLISVALSVAAFAQSAAGKTTPDKSGSGSLKTATKPLTPKSAIPSHKPRAISPPPAKTNSANDELSRLERQTTPRANATTSATRTAKLPQPKPTPAATSSGINATYQKPTIPHGR